MEHPRAGPVTPPRWSALVGRRRVAATPSGVTAVSRVAPGLATDRRSPQAASGPASRRSAASTDAVSVPAAVARAAGLTGAAGDEQQRPEDAVQRLRLAGRGRRRLGEQVRGRHGEELREHAELRERRFSSDRPASTLA